MVTLTGLREGRGFSNPAACSHAREAAMCPASASKPDCSRLNCESTRAFNAYDFIDTPVAMAAAANADDDYLRPSSLYSDGNSGYWGAGHYETVCMIDNDD